MSADLANDRDLLSGSRILVVDDSEDNRFIIGRWLRRKGANVVLAETGHDGLAKAVAERPDAIVLDVRLPDTSGLEVAQRLKGDPSTRTIPVLLRSSTAVAEAERIEGLDAGADTYLVEPISEGMLTSSMTALLRFGEAQQQLDEAMSAGVSGVFDIAIRSGATAWSESVGRIHRVAPHEFDGTVTGWFRLLHPDDRERIEQAYREIEQAGAVELDTRIIRGDGTTGWIELRGAAFVDPDGDPTRLRGVVVDVTTREVARLETDRLRRLAEHLSASIEPGDVLQHGSAALAEFGLDIVELRGGETIPGAIATATTGESSVAVLGAHGASATEFVQAVVQQVGLALDRAHRHAAEARTADRLRAALLPAPAPDVAGYEFSVFTSSAVTYERIGGDFHDVIERDGTATLVVGDVVGHGLAAANQMATVRAMLRTIVSQVGASPAEMLIEANRVFPTVCGAGAPFVTVCIGVLELTTGRITISTAGHPAPISWEGAAAHWLQIRPGPPIGITPDASFHTTEVELRPGGWLAWYTDGVFERRDEDFETTLELALARFRQDDDAASLARTAATVSPDTRPTADDRAILLVRRVSDG